ncbi:MAG: zf-TFIIB domain-containing protein [Thiotrichaceae bacterium]|nr:zf-TFIIB domain-containing protein [Thiotrichaceae bacterium]
MSINCPNCSSVTLKASQIEPQLISQQCPQCEGHWIRLAHYIDWVKSQTIEQAVVEEIDVEVEPNMTTPLICPKTQEPLIPFSVTSDIKHQLHWGQTSKSFWLDKGEWQQMQEKRVADKLTDVFSTERQSQLAPLQQQLNREHLIINAIGKENYSRLKLVRTWLHEQSDEHKALMVSFLVSKDPFKMK